MAALFTGAILTCLMSKAGDDDQTVGGDATIGATVKFFTLHISHQPT
jgi:hypothetical protein